MNPAPAAGGRHTSIDVAQVPLDAILGLREEYRREMNCQIVHDSWHARGFTSSYLLSVNGQLVGHGSVGGPPRKSRDIVKEFFARPASRGAALPLFRKLLLTSGARWIEAQTSDILLSLMLHDCAVELTSETILFADAITTTHPPPGVVLRLVTDADRQSMFPHTLEPVGPWGLECDKAIVATGGFLSHYNPPYGDIFMEVAGAYQRKGLRELPCPGAKAALPRGGAGSRSTVPQEQRSFAAHPRERRHVPLRADRARPHSGLIRGFPGSFRPQDAGKPQLTPQ